MVTSRCDYRERRGVPSIGELGSTFCASSLEDLAAVGGSHSLTEAVLFLSLTLFRLISSDHSRNPSFILHDDRA